MRGASMLAYQPRAAALWRCQHGNANVSLKNGLSVIALPFHRRALGVASGGLHDELEVAVAVGVWWVDRPGGDGGDGVD